MVKSKSSPKFMPQKMLNAKQSPFMGFQLSTPAIIAFIAYIVLALVILLPFEIPVTNEKTKEVVIIRYNMTERLVALLLLLVPTALSIYTINCMIAGSCVIWSYIVSIVSVFWVLMFVISVIVYTFNKSKMEKFEEQSLNQRLKNVIPGVFNPGANYIGIPEEKKFK
jgi:hypothetical protein